MSVTCRVLAGKFYRLMSCRPSFTIFLGVVSQAVMHGSNMFAGVHALSTFRMLHL